MVLVREGHEVQVLELPLTPPPSVLGPGVELLTFPTLPCILTLILSNLYEGLEHDSGPWSQKTKGTHFTTLAPANDLSSLGELAALPRPTESLSSRLPVQSITRGDLM